MTEAWVTKEWSPLLSWQVLSEAYCSVVTFTQIALRVAGSTSATITQRCSTVSLDFGMRKVSPHLRGKGFTRRGSASGEVVVHLGKRLQLALDGANLFRLLVLGF